MAKEQKNPRYAIYQKYDKKKDSTYYWISVKGTDKDDETIYANLFARLSKKASAKFDKNAEATSTKSITRVYAEVTDGWLKAVVGKDYNNVVIFINDFEIVEDSEDSE